MDVGRGNDRTLRDKFISNETRENRNERTEGGDERSRQEKTTSNAIRRTIDARQPPATPRSAKQLPVMARQKFEFTQRRERADDKEQDKSYREST